MTHSRHLLEPEIELGFVTNIFQSELKLFYDRNFGNMVTVLGLTLTRTHISKFCVKSKYPKIWLHSWHYKKQGCCWFQFY